MPQKYNQWTAMWAVCKAALLAIFKSPQAIFFSLFFPVVLIMVFGALTGSKGIEVDIAFDKKSDTLNPVYQILKMIPVLDVNKGSQAELEDRLIKGRVTALLEIRRLDTAGNGPRYDIHVKTTSASQRNLPALRAILQNAIDRSEEHTSELQSPI